MLRHPLIRLAIHLLLVMSLILPGISAPAGALADELHALTASAAMADMPCDEGQRGSDHKAPCDCCPQSKCDLSACLGTGCLFELPRLAAFVPPTAMPLPWDLPAPDSQAVGTLFRPPIA